MFELSQDHEDFRASVRDFAEREVEPHVAQWDKDHHLPLEVVQRMGDLGLFGLVVPERWGGSAETVDGVVQSDFTALCVAIEELGRVDQSIGITLSAGVGLGINPILTYGTDEQRDRWLPDLVAGRALAGFGLTEPDAGSDAGGTRTTATRDGDEWVIKGAKSFITNSGTDITSLVTVTARTGTTAEGRAQISAIIVPSGTPGFTVEEPYDKLGWHISDTHGLTFDGCRVPGSAVLGEVGRGFQQQMKQFVIERMFAAYSAIGQCNHALERTREYIAQRTVFGKPLAERQYVAFRLTELQAKVDLLRSHNLQTCEALLAGEDITRMASIGKLTAGRLVREVADTCMQFHGGMGYIEETWTARFMRDTRLGSIGGGADEVMLQVLARLDGLPA